MKYDVDIAGRLRLWPGLTLVPIVFAALITSPHDGCTHYHWSMAYQGARQTVKITYEALPTTSTPLPPVSPSVNLQNVSSGTISTFNIAIVVFVHSIFSFDAGFHIITSQHSSIQTVLP